MTPPYLRLHTCKPIHLTATHIVTQLYFQWFPTDFDTELEMAVLEVLLQLHKRNNRCRPGRADEVRSHDCNYSCIEGSTIAPPARQQVYLSGMAWGHSKRRADTVQMSTWMTCHLTAPLIRCCMTANCVTLASFQCRLQHKHKLVCGYLYPFCGKTGCVRDLSYGHRIGWSMDQRLSGSFTN